MRDMRLCGTDPFTGYDGDFAMDCRTLEHGSAGFAGEPAAPHQKKPMICAYAGLPPLHTRRNQ